MSKKRTPEEMYHILKNLNQLENIYLESALPPESFNDFSYFFNFLQNYFIQSNDLAGIYFQQIPGDASAFFHSFENIDEVYAIYSGLDVCVYKQINLPFDRLHSESCFEAVYVMEGSAQFQLSEERFRLQSGDIIFHPPGEKYLLHAEPDSIVVNIEIRNKYVFSIYHQLFKNLLSAIRFFDNYFYQHKEHNYLLFRSCNAPEIKDHVLQMMSETLIGSVPFRNEILKHYFELTVFYILRCSKLDSISSKRFSMKERYHMDLMNYLADNYRTATLESTAADFHLSKNYISHIIHDIGGETFVSVLNRIRTEKVKEYLSETNLILDDIAELVGFSDSSYLWRVFKKSTGMSPSDYRREHHHDYMS